MIYSNIVLIGLPGTGKSTIGRALGDHLGWDFIDTDELIEMQEGYTITELFKSHGEEYFRKIESSVIASILKQSNKVISTGGGSVLLLDNKKNMISSGFIVALTASHKTLINRLKNDESRPLLSGDKQEQLLKMLQSRNGAYDFAHLSIDTDALPVEQTIEVILARYQARDEG